MAALSPAVAKWQPKQTKCPSKVLLNASKTMQTSKNPYDILSAKQKPIKKPFKTSRLPESSAITREFFLRRKERCSTLALQHSGRIRKSTLATCGVKNVPGKQKKKSKARPKPPGIFSKMTSQLPFNHEAGKRSNNSWPK